MDLSHLRWRKASRSSGNGGACVEVARDLPGVVAVRDSKDPHGPMLAIAPEDWRAFTDQVKAGIHDPA
jgi:hypothetical protein